MPVLRFAALSLTAATLLAAPLFGDTPPLKEAAKDLFLIGGALNASHISGKDKKAVALVQKHFDTITPENVLKWEVVHPKPGKYEFDLPDKYVEFGEKNGMFIVGHTLMWHQQAPAWLFKDEKGGEVSREELLKRLQDHIRTVVGRYKGRINGWDVVNEAIDDTTGELRMDRPWYKILGKEGIFAAFAAAHEADPNAELYYNDYSVHNPKKRAGIIALVKEIRARGLRIDGVGTQEHHLLDTPTAAEIDATFVDLKAAGFPVMVTELDVSMLPRPSGDGGADLNLQFSGAKQYDPYRKGLPAEQQAAHTRRYAELFAIYAKHHESIKRVTFWGVEDGSSWLNGWPIRGRVDYALVFDRKYQEKPAVQAIVDVLKDAKR